MKSQSLTVFETEKSDPRIASAFEVARAFVIDSPEAFIRADRACVELLEIKRDVEAKWKEPKAKAKAVHQAVVDLEKAELSQVDAVRAVYKAKLDVYRKAEEAKRLAAETIAREAAKKATEDLALKTAEAVEKTGNGVVASQVLEAMAQAAPPVHIESTVPKARTMIRELWEVESIDESKLPDEYWVPDRQAIAAVVRAKKVANPIPGVVARPRTV